MLLTSLIVLEYSPYMYTHVFFCDLFFETTGGKHHGN